MDFVTDAVGGWLISFELSSLVVLGLVGLVVHALYLALSRFWWGGDGSKPVVHYQEGSRLCDQVVKSCPTLQEIYTPPLLWGKNGHVQSILFGVIGRFSVPNIRGERHSLVVADGSTVTYDIFEPPEGTTANTYTLFVCPGIGNCSETDYIKSFADYGMTNGYRVAVFNHLGALPNIPLTGNRIYTYGGTGDITAVYEDLCSHYPHTKFIGVGFSMGACIIVRFLAEKPERQEHFVCAISVGQGYDPTLAMPYFNDWTKLRRFYNFNISIKQLKLLRRHWDKLSHGHKRKVQNGRTVTTSSDVTHGGHDCNGYSLDPSKFEPPDDKIWSVGDMGVFDEYFTRRVMGFETTFDLYKWTSCVEIMYNIKELPVLLVNSCDDPLIPEFIHEIPIKYTAHNHNAMFLTTEYGGHCAYFEGGIVRANTVAWIDRVILEYARACIDFTEKLKQ